MGVVVNNGPNYKTESGPQAGCGLVANSKGHQPDWFKPRFDSIPHELKPLPQFLLWKAERRGGKWTKPPYNARNGSSGSSTDPQSWSSFDEAKKAFERGGYTGIGIAMYAPLAGVDLDHCIDSGTTKIADWAMVIVRAFDSYAEISPSGTGLRILFKAELPGAGLNRTVHGCHVEIYDRGRYLTLTGHHVEDTPDSIEPRQEAASQFYQWILDHTETRKNSTSRPVIDPKQKGRDLTDSEVIECAMNASNSAKFEKLWDGDMSGYKDERHPEGNPSRADAAMVGLLCYHSLDDEQVERLWQASKLYRDKLERRDYIERTINFIRKNQTDVCAKALPKRETIKLSPLGIPRIASEFVDVVLLMLKEYEPVFTGEDKLTFLALISIFNGRKTAAVSRGLLAQRIRRLNDNGIVASSKTLDQFGGRRLTALKKALKRSIKEPVLTMIEHSKKRGIDKRTQKPKASRYSLDLSIFREALALARFYYDEWCEGKPRFEEWKGDKNYQPNPNPGKCREVAARQVARKYSKLDQAEASEPSKSQPDDFSKWVGCEKAIWRAASKWADAVDDLGKTTADRRVHAGRLLDRTKLILLQKDKRERRRMLLKLLQDTESRDGGLSFMHEGKLSEDIKLDQVADIGPACSHNSVNTNGDTQEREAGEVRCGPAVWRNRDTDEQVTVTGEAGIGPDGRHYVYVVESKAAIPVDELVYEVEAAPLSDEELEEQMDEFLASILSEGDAA